MIEMQYDDAGRLQILQPHSPTVSKLVRLIEHQTCTALAVHGARGSYLRTDVEREALRQIKRQLDTWIQDRLLWRDQRGRWEIVP